MFHTAVVQKQHRTYHHRKYWTLTKHNKCSYRHNVKHFLHSTETTFCCFILKLFKWSFKICCRRSFLINNTKKSIYLLAPAVLPGNPFHPVSRIAEAVVTGKLLAVPISMATLGTNQSQEVEFAQVYLQETTTNKQPSVKHRLTYKQSIRLMHTKLQLLA